MGDSFLVVIPSARVKNGAASWLETLSKQLDTGTPTWRAERPVSSHGNIKSSRPMLLQQHSVTVVVLVVSWSISIILCITVQSICECVDVVSCLQNYDHQDSHELFSSLFPTAHSSYFAIIPLHLHWLQRYLYCISKWFSVHVYE